MTGVEKKQQKKVKVDEDFLFKILDVVDGFSRALKDLHEWQKTVDDRFTAIHKNIQKTMTPVFQVKKVPVPEIKLPVQSERKDHEFNFEIHFKDNRSADEIVFVGKKVQEEVEDIIIKYRVKKLNMKIDI